MHTRGYTLLELLIIIAVISTVSLGVYESIVHFQYQSQVEAASQQFLAVLRDAQSKSRSSILPEGTTYDTYKEPGGVLPEYGVVLNGNTYVLRRNATLADGTVESVDEQTYAIDSALSVTPPSESTMFARVSGLPSSNATYTFNKSAITTTKTITVSTDGLISIQ